MIVMASKGHFLTQIPQPIHNSSEIKAILSVGETSIQSLPEDEMPIYRIVNKITHSYDRTRFLAFLTTLFGLAFVVIKNR